MLSVYYELLNVNYARFSIRIVGFHLTTNQKNRKQPPRGGGGQWNMFNLWDWKKNVDKIGQVMDNFINILVRGDHSRRFEEITSR